MHRRLYHQSLSRFQLQSARPANKMDRINIAGKNCAVDLQYTNIPTKIQELSQRNLLRTANHPLSILKQKISTLFPTEGPSKNGTFRVFDDLHPVVSTQDNFDRLRIPADHVSRTLHDSYYLTADSLLRTHTSAHQHSLISQLLQARKSFSAEDMFDGFLVFADVYRRDEVDSSHYPVFHQVEGVRLFSRNDLTSLKKNFASGVSDNDLTFSGDNCLQNVHAGRQDDVKHVALDLRMNLERIVRSLFTVDKSNGEELDMRWVESFFPFTQPSWELEVKYRGKWLEVAGCGIIQQSIIQNCLDESHLRGSKNEEYVGWAFGMGLERIAMVLFDIPDIRLFWSTDPRFLSQFESGEIVKYKPISKYPSTHRDVSFWTSKDHGFHQNDLFEIVRDVAGDLAETVEMVDEFLHPKSGRDSKCFRITYRSVDCTLTNEQVNEIQENFIKQIIGKLKVEIR